MYAVFFFNAGHHHKHSQHSHFSETRSRIEDKQHKFDKFVRVDDIVDNATGDADENDDSDDDPMTKHHNTDYTDIDMQSDDVFGIDRIQPKTILDHVDKQMHNTTLPAIDAEHKVLANDTMPSVSHDTLAKTSFIGVGNESSARMYANDIVIDKNTLHRPSSSSSSLSTPSLLNHSKTHSQFANEIRKSGTSWTSSKPLSIDSRVLIMKPNGTITMPSITPQVAQIAAEPSKQQTDYGQLHSDNNDASDTDTVPTHQFDELNDEQLAGDDGTVDETNSYSFDAPYDQNNSYDSKSDGTNDMMAPAIFRMEDIDLEDLDETSRNNRLDLMKGRDVVTRFLQIVESQHLLGANCTAGTALNLGEGIVDRYAQDRFRVEAEVAVNRANMLTRYACRQISDLCVVACMCLYDIR